MAQRPFLIGPPERETLEMIGARAAFQPGALVSGRVYRDRSEYVETLVGQHLVEPTPDGMLLLTATGAREALRSTSGVR